MNRRKARERALQLLFQFDFTGQQSPPDLLQARASDRQDEEVRSFSGELARGTIEHLEEIDGVIQAAAEHWKMERMAAVDRNILRVAVFELLFRKDIPPAVSINEALEIAKKYSSSESVPFVNGLLDKIARECGKK